MQRFQRQKPCYAVPRHALRLIARYHAGNLQVLLGVIGCTLTQAEEEIYDLNKALHKSKAETEAKS